ncbi:hypothetical protein ACFJGW_17460 [Burkholderiaceae bacterium UC74_6]
MRVIDAVGFDELGRVDRVRWFRVNPDLNAMQGAAEIVPAIQVVDAVYAGEHVSAVFYVEGHRIPGPNVQPVADSTGHEWLQMVGPIVEGRAFKDMAKLEGP